MNHHYNKLYQSYSEKTTNTHFVEFSQNESARHILSLVAEFDDVLNDDQVTDCHKRINDFIRRGGNLNQVILDRSMLPFAFRNILSLHWSGTNAHDACILHPNIQLNSVSNYPYLKDENQRRDCETNLFVILKARSTNHNVNTFKQQLVTSLPIDELFIRRQPLKHLRTLSIFDGIVRNSFRDSTLDIASLFWNRLSQHFNSAFLRYDFISDSLTAIKYRQFEMVSFAQHVHIIEVLNQVLQFQYQMETYWQHYVSSFVNVIPELALITVQYAAPNADITTLQRTIHNGLVDINSRDKTHLSITFNQCRNCRHQLNVKIFVGKKECIVYNQNCFRDHKFKCQCDHILQTDNDPFTTCEHYRRPWSLPKTGSRIRFIRPANSGQGAHGTVIQSISNHQCWVKWDWNHGKFKDHLDCFDDTCKDQGTDWEYCGTQMLQQFETIQIKSLYEIHYQNEIYSQNASRKFLDE